MKAAGVPTAIKSNDYMYISKGYIVIWDRGLFIVTAARFWRRRRIASGGLLTFSRQKLHLVTHDFRGIMGDAVLLVLSRLEPALDKDSFAFCQEFTGEFAQFPPHGHLVPFRPFLPFSGSLLLKFLAGCQTETCHCLPGCRVAQLWVLAQITAQHNHVE